MQTNPDDLTLMVYSAIKGNIDWDNLVPTLMAGGQFLENIPHLTGSQRLKILQKTLRYALNKSSLSESDKEKTLGYIDTIVPIAMQAAILASKQPIVSQLVQDVCVGCWTKK